MTEPASLVENNPGADDESKTKTITSVARFGNLYWIWILFIKNCNQNLVSANFGYFSGLLLLKTSVGCISLYFDADIFAFWKSFDVDILDFLKCFDVGLLGFSKIWRLLLKLSCNTDMETKTKRKENQNENLSKNKTNICRCCSLF